MARTPTRVAYTAFREVSFDKLGTETVVRKLERDERASRRRRRILLITAAVMVASLAMYLLLIWVAPSGAP